MPWRSFAPRVSLVMKLDADGLVIHFQDIRVALHRIDTPQLHMLTFKLDRATHFHAGVAPAHIGRMAAYPSLRLRFADALNVGFGLRLNIETRAPSAKFLICEPSHRVFSSLCLKE